MKKDEIRQKKEEVLSMLPTKSKKELEEDYREMAKEFIDSSIYKESLYISIMEAFGEEKTKDIIAEADFIYEIRHKKLELSNGLKKLSGEVLNNKGDQEL